MAPWDNEQNHGDQLPVLEWGVCGVGSFAREAIPIDRFKPDFGGLKLSIRLGEMNRPSP